jgi:hypothetical protein
VDEEYSLDARHITPERDAWFGRFRLIVDPTVVIAIAFWEAVKEGMTTHIARFTSKT